MQSALGTYSNNKITKFSSSGTEEFHITLSSEPDNSVGRQYQELFSNYHDICREYELDKKTEVFIDIYSSDIYNHFPEIHSLQEENTVISAHQLSPLAEGVRAVIKAYHIKPPCKLKKQNIKLSSGKAALIQHSEYNSLWIKNLTSNTRKCNSYLQSNEIFEKLHSFLTQHNISIYDHGIRSWIYVKDIDNHYNGMVKARNEYYKTINQNQPIRYLAGTGIEGQMKEPETLVSFNGLFYTNIKPEQVKKMSAGNQMNDPIKYGVNFERGLEVLFGDRKHLYISGTASINNKGEVVHVGDIQGQTRRTLENINTLLANSGAGFSDMMYMIVYLRDPHDYQTAKKIVESEIEFNLPILYLKASVCRPEWLVEMEGIAILPDSNPLYPPF